MHQIFALFFGDDVQLDKKTMNIRSPLFIFIVPRWEYTFWFPKYSCMPDE